MTTPAPPRPDGRNTILVRLPRDLVERLAPLRKHGESLGQLLRRLLSHDDAKPADDLPHV